MISEELQKNFFKYFNGMFLTYKVGPNPKMQLATDLILKTNPISVTLHQYWGRQEYSSYFFVFWTPNLFREIDTILQ